MGEISLEDTVAYSIFDSLYITYKSVNTGIKRVYAKNRLITRFDEKEQDTVAILQRNSNPLSGDAIFGSNLKKRGTLIRGFTVGTTKDFTLNSGLRLQLSGKLSDEIEIVAALTDENTPIQPEGNTERLDELDKVFIEIRHPNAIGTFGDYNLNYNIGEFGKMQRKLQGLKGELIYGNHRVTTAIASSKGEFHSNTFAGEDGVQGPYRLTGSDNEQDIIVIAGSERVYLDGEELTRGENNDYTIEYGNAEVTFTTKRIITSASRIVIDFEYTDRKYSRSFFSSSYEGSFFQNKLRIGISYAREGDDEGAPIDLLLSDEDKKLLEKAGDDVTKAARSGVALAVIDSTGRRNGLYTKKDTILQEQPYSIYTYAPDDTSAIYLVEFSYVGEYNGDYRKVSLGNYYFAGIGQGNYMPIEYLPLPELKQGGNIFIQYEPVKGVKIGAEFAGSMYDKNTFSAIGDEDNSGNARNITFSMEQKKIQLFGVNFGKVGFDARDRFKLSRYISLDRLDDTDFNRSYNTDGVTGVNETLREFAVNYSPDSLINIYSKYGYLNKDQMLESDRYITNVKVGRENLFYTEYNLDYVATTTSLKTSSWNRQDGKVSYQYNYFKPGVSFLYEEKLDNVGDTDSLYSSSLKYQEVQPFFQIISLYGFTLNTAYLFREEFSPLSGVLIKESEARGQSFGLTYNGISQVRSSLLVTLRNKTYTDKFAELGNLDNETVLIKSENRLNFLKRFFTADMFYEVSTKKTAKLERVFVKVSKGEGNYIYLGDLDSNGVADEYEFEQTIYDGTFIRTTIPTEELFPVIDLQTNLRFGFDFSKVVGKKKWWHKALGAISTETVWRVQEKSREEETSRIYLMDFSYFLSEENTVSGSNYLQQDIHLFKNKRDLSFRFRFKQNRSLSQYSSGVEKAYNNKKSLRIKFRLIQEVSNQTDYTVITDNVAAPASSSRNMEVDGEELVTDFSYRPFRSVEIGFKVRVERSTDYYPEKPTIIDVNAITLRVNFSFAGKGRLAIEGERGEYLANTDENYIPFEILRGNFIGKNYYIRLNFDYRISQNLQTSVYYTGRAQGGNKFIHTMKAEARAFF